MKMKKKGKTGGAGPGGDLEGKDRWMMEEEFEERVLSLYLLYFDSHF